MQIDANYVREPSQVTNLIADAITRLIGQEYSWAPLSITYDCMRRLCTALTIYPAFLDILRAFGEKIEVCNDSFNGFHIESNSTGQICGISLPIDVICLSSTH